MRGFVVRKAQRQDDEESESEVEAQPARPKNVKAKTNGVKKVKTSGPAAPKRPRKKAVTNGDGPSTEGQAETFKEDSSFFSQSRTLLREGKEGKGRKLTQQTLCSRRILHLPHW